MANANRKVQMNANEFAARLSAALREQPPGTAALLGDFAMAVLATIRSPSSMSKTHTLASWVTGSR
jgi:hypothetical protein